jgi:hypothetical protein
MFIATATKQTRPLDFSRAGATNAEIAAAAMYRTKGSDPEKAGEIMEHLWQSFTQRVSSAVGDNWTGWIGNGLLHTIIAETSVWYIAEPLDPTYIDAGNGSQRRLLRCGSVAARAYNVYSARRTLEASLGT